MFDPDNLDVRDFVIWACIAYVATYWTLRFHGLI